jgi:SAM-dependent methyltransferase
VNTRALSRPSESMGQDSPLQCPLCAGERPKFLFKKDAYPVFRCTSCRAEFLYPQPDNNVLALIYGPDYFLTGEDSGGDQRVAALKAATARRYLRCITDRMKAREPHLLEIGCGTGELLAQAQEQGFRVRGIEFSPSSAAKANRRLGGPIVEAGTVESTKVQPGSFDVVIGCDVLEHVRNPQAFLASVHAFLKPGGIVFLITPSIDSWSRKLLGRHWMEYKTEHLFYFSRRSLVRLLEATGFREVSLASNRKVLSLDYVNRHFQRFPVPVCSPLMAVGRAMLPGRLAFRHFTVPASGLMVMARKGESA